ncbi:MmgE/PrpD family protein [Bordetella sp. BOR01]|nr:MmgE/PrpD family protein [Bordetella sp. BOR01]
MNVEQFDAEVVNKAKALCVSALGMTVAGSRIHAGQVLASYARGHGGHPHSSVLGAGFRTSAELAAFVNATAAHSTELEDDSWPESMYTCHIIPAVFALGEELKSTGKDILEAFVLGYEVQARPGMILTDSGATGRGWLTAPHLGTIGVAAAAAKLFKLDAKQTQMAISLAVSQASGSTRQMGTGAHLYEAGVAGRNGINAARLAKLGLTGVPDILEGVRGYFDALAGQPDIDFELGTGKDFRVMQIGFKKYTACYLMQRIIDGVIELVNQHDIAADDVETVAVEVNPTFPEIIKFPEPKNGEESRFSLHHCVAAALMREEISVHTFTDEGARDSRLKAQWHKTRIIVNPSWERAILGKMNPLTITTKDGRQYHRVCVTSHGDPEDPLSDDEVKHKYLTCVEGIICTEHAHRGAELIFELDTLNDVSELMRLLTFPSSKDGTHTDCNGDMHG